MKKFVVPAFLLLMLLTVSVTAQLHYDSEITVSIMRQNAQAFGQLRSAAGGGDYLAAAEALAEIANGSFTLLEYDPPKGEKTVWDRIHSEVVRAALDGIRAAGSEDDAALSRAVDRIAALNGEGHQTFR